MTHRQKQKDDWIKPDLTPPPGRNIVVTGWGWAVQHPENLELGKGVDIGYGTYINARFGVVIEDDVEIGGGCHIYSHDTICNKMGKVILEERCKIRSLSIILPGVTIGKGAVVGAMSLVKSDVAAGIPVVSTVRYGNRDRGKYEI